MSPGDSHHLTFQIETVLELLTPDFRKLKSKIKAAIEIQCLANYVSALLFRVKIYSMHMTVQNIDQPTKFLCNHLA